MIATSENEEENLIKILWDFKPSILIWNVIVLHKFILSHQTQFFLSFTKETVKMTVMSKQSSSSGREAINGHLWKIGF